jgi:hypothetical protein
MNDSYDRLVSMITPLPTDVQGLRFFPSLEPHCSNDHDPPLWGWISSVTNSACNLAVVRDVVQQLGPNLRACMEIGVNRETPSLSTVLLHERPAGSFYLGVDLEDKHYLDNPDANTWTLISNSHDQDLVRGFLAKHGITQLDALFIDGWHSVNTTVNDWRYADLLSEHGVVIMHDTNSHPGCVAVYEAVDTDMYHKQRYCTVDDYGIAVFRRLHHANS